MIRHIKPVFRHLLFWSIVFFAIGLSAIRLFFWSVEDYKSDLEQKIYELTSIAIEIGTLQANMRGINPEVILKDIKVLATEQTDEAPIKLEQIRLGIDLVQVVLTQQLLPSSWLSLVGVELSVVRKKDGSLSIEGLNAGDSEQPYWLLQGGRYEILKSDISWLDEQNNQPLIKFNEVSLLLKNDSDSQMHEVHLMSELPDQYGGSLRVSMSIQGDVFAQDNIDGLVYIEAKDVKLVEFSSLELPLGISVLEGTGSFSKWITLEQSDISAIAGRLQVQDVVFAKGLKNNTRFEIKHLSTEFNAAKNEDGWQGGVKNFSLEAKKQIWPPLGFYLSLNQDLTQFSAAITQLDLQELNQFVHFFSPLEAEMQAMVSKLDVKGRLKDFSMFVDVDNNQYAMNGNFENIFINGYEALPKIERLTGSIKGNNEEGLLTLNTTKSQVFFAKLFRDPFIINSLNGLLKWQQKDDEVLIKSAQLNLETKDAVADVSLFVKIPKNDKPVFMDLQATFSKLYDVSHVPEYYPVSIMDEGVLQWLDQAFVSGKIEQGGVLVQGELNQFPFVEGQGVFEVLFQASDVELKYAPEWPHLKKVAAEVVFFKDSLLVELSHAETRGLILQKAVVEIDSFENSQHVLVEGLVKGSIADSLLFLQQTPLHASVDGVLDVIDTKGATNVEMELKIPLSENASEQVSIIADLNHAEIKVKAIDLNITDVSGDLKVTEKGVFSQKIIARTLGFPVTATVASTSSNTLINVNAKTNIFQIQKQFDFLNSPLISERIKGAIAYKVKLNLPNKENRPAKLKIESNLLGVSVDLPEVLAKTAKEKKFFEINLLLGEQTLLPLWLNYNGVLKAAVDIDKNQSHVHSAQILYGKGQVKKLRKKGVNVHVKQDTLDLTQWAALFSEKGHERESNNESVNGISVSAKQLLWKNKRYGSLELAMHGLAKEWQGNISSAFAKGAFSLPKSADKHQQIKLNMAYLNLSELMQIDLQSESFKSDNLPLLDVMSDQLILNDINLGQLEITTDRLADGVRFKKINITANDYKIIFSANWLKNGKENVTELDGTVIADDVAVFLSQMGFENDFKETSALFKYSGGWKGSPYGFSLKEMQAEIDVNFKGGRISSIEPGFGRILGLLAMEQWLKRLALDFGDIYKQGLSFNKITGHFKVIDGLAISKNLLVDAVPAIITIKGQADILRKTVDHTLSVVPKSSGALPIAGTIVSNIAGAITNVITKDYEEGYFFRSKYKITGTWDDIQVTPLHEQGGVLTKTWSGLTDFSWMKPAIE